MSTYVMSDIHGEYELFVKLLKKIKFSEEDRLYVLGDVLDRGSHPIRVLKEMMKYPNIIPVVGNHEVMGLPCLRFLMKEITEESIDSVNEDTIQLLLDWTMNGSITTTDEFRKLSPDERRDVIEYIEDFSVYEEVSVGNREYLLVHAGLSGFSPERLIEDYELDELVFKRPDYDTVYFEDVYVISGHTPTQQIAGNPRPGYIYRVNNHIAIDCGACFEGRLAALCLETDEEFYVEAQGGD